MAIIEEIATGLEEADTPRELVVDRRAAIEVAIGSAKKGDIVLICGKGHEPYQIIGDKTLHFDDREVAAEILSRI